MSVLDALTPTERSFADECYERRLYHGLVRDGMACLLKDALTRYVPIAPPAPGTDWLIATPSSSSWELLGAQGQLATSAVAATRNPALFIKDESLGRDMYQIGPSGTVAASGTATFSWLAGIGAINTLNGFQALLPMPPFVLSTGMTLRVGTGGLQVSDQWSVVGITVIDFSPIRIVQAARRIVADLESAGGIR